MYMYMLNNTELAQSILVGRSSGKLSSILHHRQWMHLTQFFDLFVDLSYHQCGVWPMSEGTQSKLVFSATLSRGRAEGLDKL